MAAASLPPDGPDDLDLSSETDSTDGPVYSASEADWVTEG